MSESLEISSVKELKIMQDSVENLTICKKLYGKYYNEVGVGTSETLRNLLREKLIEIDKKTTTEFLHNMSVQALSKSNVKILLEFDKILLIGLFRQQIGFL